MMTEQQSLSPLPTWTVLQTHQTVYFTSPPSTSSCEIDELDPSSSSQVLTLTGEPSTKLKALRLYTPSRTMQPVDPTSVALNAGFKVPGTCDACRSYAGEDQEASCDFETTRLKDGGGDRCNNCAANVFKCDNLGTRVLRCGRVTKSTKVWIRKPKKWVYPLQRDLEHWQKNMKNARAAGPAFYVLKEENIDIGQETPLQTRAKKRKGKPELEVLVSDVGEGSFKRLRHGDVASSPNVSVPSQSMTFLKRPVPSTVHNPPAYSYDVDSDTETQSSSGVESAPRWQGALKAGKSNHPTASSSARIITERRNKETRIAARADTAEEHDRKGKERDSKGKGNNELESSQAAVPKAEDLDAAIIAEQRLIAVHERYKEIMSEIFEEKLREAYQALGMLYQKREMGQ
ncbi:hypothetical protein HGRIS_006483 [Hohenbuehelia grisea]|uniref:Uncharacterized protein n=1 Tax=Hohenbuehelia grisea TaxID=104357 RepID=A0ABR3K1D3_9AGAR